MGLVQTDPTLHAPVLLRCLCWPETFFCIAVCVFCCCSRTFINDTPVAFDPERAMAELVLHTHYLPRHWRGRAHSAEVQQAVNSMFTLKVWSSTIAACGLQTPI